MGTGLGRRGDDAPFSLALDDCVVGREHCVGVDEIDGHSRVESPNLARDRNLCSLNISSSQRQGNSQAEDGLSCLLLNVLSALTKNGFNTLFKSPPNHIHYQLYSKLVYGGDY
jgi:hypothetical protein